MTANRSVFSHFVQGYGFLLGAALLWGTAFVFQKNATDHIDTFGFNCLRFGIAVPALLLLYFLPKHLFQPDEKDVPKQKRLRHSAWFIGGGAGIFMFVAISLQQWGLSYTTVAKSGFLTSLYIILVPMLALLIGQRCRAEVWVGAAITVMGVYWLSGNALAGDSESGFNIGDVMTLGCALGWALQVLWFGVFIRYANVLTVAVTQMLVVSLLSGLVMLLLWWFEMPVGDSVYQLPTWDVIDTIKKDLLYTGVVSAAVAFTFQILGQRNVPASNAALVMSTEAIFALLAGVLLLGEGITMRALLGCACIMVGIVLAQLQGKVFKTR